MVFSWADSAAACVNLSTQITKKTQKVEMDVAPLHQHQILNY